MPENIEKLTPSAEAPKMEVPASKEKETAFPAETAPVPELAHELAPPPATPIASAPAAVPAPVDPLTEAVEKILAEDLVDFYRAMKPAEREKFKLKGEETTAKIRRLLDGTTIKVKEILKLIISWIKMIPGINKFFLEQESKIKTDKIIELHRRTHGEE
jgi:hypothetical protein